ncbi:MAG: ABC transporter transmembrane domain-containing protein [Flammeovirgaceae bacterium]|nr:ABC transporter transmembrane domain-containing protein [Flammeovirgaceae bacterium]
MKTYFRLLAYAKPYATFIVPYFSFSILGILFDLSNFSLIIPLLDTLFNKVTEDLAQATTLPSFSLEVSYFRAVFYYYFGQIVSEYGKQSALLFIVGITALASLMKNLFRYLSQKEIESFKARLVKNLREDLFNKITRLHIGYFTAQRKGDLLSRVTADASEVEYSIANSVSSILKDPLYIIVYFAVLFYISTELTIFTLLVIPVSGGTIAYITKKLKKDSKRTQQLIGNIASLIDETIGGLRVIKAFNATSYIQKRFSEENENYRKAYKSLAYKRELASPLSEFMGVAIVAIILLYGGHLVLSDDAPLKASAFIAYLVFFTQILQPSKAFSNAISNIQRGIVAGERMLSVIDTPEEVKNPSSPKILEHFQSRIEFKNVRFAYEEKEVLKGISFCLEKGKTVALVGASGSGKSTIADLIPRFYDVKSGQILIDGVDIREYDLESLRRQMGIVTQESILFNDTIFNNIAFGTVGAKKEEVVRAAKIANAHEFIMQTEKGYDTVIGDRGMKLSGGQRQRLSIARAVFKNPPILILDEATSALDTESEKLVQDALQKLMKNRTSLVIAHRLSTIQHADEILVINDGQIVEQGTHQSLMQQQGLYKKLQEMQTVQ